MSRDYDVEAILGIPVEETPETLAFDMAAQFSAQVSHVLDEKGMTLKELADAMGVAQPSLCKMLGPKSNVTMKTVAKIAIALGCDVEPPALSLPASDSRESALFVPFSDKMSVYVNPARRTREAPGEVTMAKEG